MLNNLLLVVNNDAFGRQMARWARVIKSRTDWSPIIYISSAYMERHVDHCIEHGIPVFSDDPDFQTDGKNRRISESKSFMSGSVDKLRRFGPISIILRGIKRSLFLFRFISTVSEVQKHLYFIRKLIKDNHIAVMLISESSPAYGAPHIIESAHREGIPVITLPIEKATSRHYAENYLYDTDLYLNRIINKVISLVKPHWVFEHTGIKLIRLQPELILSLEWLGLDCPNPWLLVNNSEDAIAVDSEASLEHYLMEGIPADCLHLVGNAEHDLMYETIQNRAQSLRSLCSRLDLKTNTPILLSPLVQDHYNSGRPECDFQDYESMVEFWVKSLATVQGYQVIINLHPSHSYNQETRKWNYLEKWGVRVCNDDLTTLIPLSDLYVAAGSSTIPWAIACGIPVINYDIYRYRQMLYQDTPGVLEVQEQEDFLFELGKITKDARYYQQIKNHQVATSRKWGILDGKANERLIRLIKSLHLERSKDNIH